MVLDEAARRASMLDRQMTSETSEGQVRQFVMAQARTMVTTAAVIIAAFALLS